MKLLVSTKMELPTVYLVTSRSEIKDIPIGIPFIYGDNESERDIVRVLEYEILYQSAIASGFDFKFRDILRDAGYLDLKEFNYQHPVFVDFASEETSAGDIPKISRNKLSNANHGQLHDYMRDSAVYVDITKLKELNVFPIWLTIIEEALMTNIHNFTLFNSNMYNKKLDGMYGGIDLVSPPKNLIIIDISGSIPRGVSSTCLTLAKNLAETFYSDLIITGSKSTMYEYEDIGKLDVHTLYSENGMDNDQTFFKKILSEGEKNYGTVIVFGDDHHPGRGWSNDYNHSTKNISDADGKKLCKWTVGKLISFHTHGTGTIAGYARWFKPKKVEKIDGWVKYLNN